MQASSSNTEAIAVGVAVPLGVLLLACVAMSVFLILRRRRRRRRPAMRTASTPTTPVSFDSQNPYEHFADRSLYPKGSSFRSQAQTQQQLELTHYSTDDSDSYYTSKEAGPVTHAPPAVTLEAVQGTASSATVGTANQHTSQYPGSYKGDTGMQQRDGRASQSQPELMHQGSSASQQERAQQDKATNSQSGVQQSGVTSQLKKQQQLQQQRSLSDARVYRRKFAASADNLLPETTINRDATAGAPCKPTDATAGWNK